VKRMGGAILKKDEYESQVLEALENINTRSLRLLRESEGSEKWMISDGMKRILVGQLKTLANRPSAFTTTNALFQKRRARYDKNLGMVSSPS